MATHAEWITDRGAHITRNLIAQVDHVRLALLYTVETSNNPTHFESLMRTTNRQTQIAWEIGWMNPRSEGRLVFCRAMLRDWGLRS